MKAAANCTVTAIGLLLAEFTFERTNAMSNWAAYWATSLV